MHDEKLLEEIKDLDEDIIFYFRNIKNSLSTPMLNYLRPFIQAANGPIDRRVKGNLNTTLLDFPVKVLHPLEFKPDFINRSLAQLTIDSAKEMIDNNPNETFNIFWSGGIDSTQAALGFFRANVNNKVNIIYTEDSLQYTWSKPFADLLEQKFNFIKVDDVINYQTEEGIDVNGMIAETLFGLQHSIKELQKNNLLYEEYKGDNPYIDALMIGWPHEVKDFFDIHYYIILNFAYQWQMVTSLLKPGKVFNPEKNLPFFGTDLFQQWVMHNYYLVKENNCTKNLQKQAIAELGGEVLKEHAMSMYQHPSAIPNRRFVCNLVTANGNQVFTKHGSKLDDPINK